MTAPFLQAKQTRLATIQKGARLFSLAASTQPEVGPVETIGSLSGICVYTIGAGAGGWWWGWVVVVVVGWWWVGGGGGGVTVHDVIGYAIIESFRVVLTIEYRSVIHYTWLVYKTGRRRRGREGEEGRR